MNCIPRANQLGDAVRSAYGFHADEPAHDFGRFDVYHQNRIAQPEHLSHGLKNCLAAVSRSRVLLMYPSSLVFVDGFR